MRTHYWTYQCKACGNQPRAYYMNTIGHEQIDNQDSSFNSSKVKIIRILETVGIISFQK